MIASLSEASVVIIGGSSGMGLATAKAAHAAGARVTIAGRDPDRLAAARAEIGEEVVAVPTDVGDEAAVRSLFASVDRVDHVANFGGTFAFGPLVDADSAALQDPVSTRFWGPVHIARYAAPRMTGGSLTFTTGSGVDRPGPGTAVFSAAAGGAEVLARALARELAPIRVNVVRPGLIDTPLSARFDGDPDERSTGIPLRRAGTVDEIAHAFLFLMTNEYVTGVTLSVDGGGGLV